MCQHVYNSMGPGPCGYCGLETRDPNWTNLNTLYAQYKEKVGYFYNSTTWWSI